MLIAIDVGNAEQVGIDMMNMNGLYKYEHHHVFSVLVTRVFVDAVSNTKNETKPFIMFDFCNYFSTTIRVH